MFQHLGKTGKHLPERQGRQETIVHQHPLRKRESPDFILQPIEINTCFAANGSIHLRQQSRRDIHTTDAPLETRSCKTAHIRDNPTPHIQQYGIAAGSGNGKP